MTFHNVGPRRNTNIFRAWKKSLVKRKVNVRGVPRWVRGEEYQGELPVVLLGQLCYEWTRLGLALSHKHGILFTPSMSWTKVVEGKRGKKRKIKLAHFLERASALYQSIYLATVRDMRISSPNYSRLQSQSTRPGFISVGLRKGYKRALWRSTKAE